MARATWIIFAVLVMTPLVTSRNIFGFSCTRANQCGMDECCIFDRAVRQGVCRPMRRVAWDCYMRQPYAWVRPEQMITHFDQCPCDTGLFCAPITGKVHPLYGQEGICTFG